MIRLLCGNLVQYQCAHPIRKRSRHHVLYHIVRSQTDHRLHRRSLSLLLLVSLLLYPLSVSQEQEVWHEDLVPWGTRGWRRRRCRRVRVSRLRFLKRRGMVLLCRLSLMAVLLVTTDCSIYTFAAPPLIPPQLGEG